MNGNQNMVCIRSISMFLQHQKLWINCRTMKLTASFLVEESRWEESEISPLTSIERQKSISL